MLWQNVMRSHPHYQVHQLIYATALAISLLSLTFTDTERIWASCRSILNAIFYVQRTGCQWEMLPHDLPPYTTVYGYFQKWQRKGI
ncbi:transposase [Calothrix sp. NIES-2098]|nr:transposase [Calothrix sp. NIES-2098]